MTPEEIRYCLENRSQVLTDLDRIEAEGSLLEFARQAWHVLEPPSRKFLRGRAIEIIAEHLEAVTRGEIKKLLINVPPGFMKSLLVSVLWPAWEWGPRNMPGLRYILASYSPDLTIRDNTKSRRVMLSEWYQQNWGDRFELLAGEQNAKERYENDRTGFRIATSVEGLGTGERGDRTLIDDPHNVKSGESDAKRNGVLQWYSEVMSTRVNDPNTHATVMVMQRVHERDLSGHVLEKELGFVHLCLPMEYETDHPHPCVHDWRRKPGELLWPERYSATHIEKELKPSLSSWGGSYAVSGQLQQRPVPRGGKLFKTGKLLYCEPADVPQTGIACRGWDFASSKNPGAAYTAGVKLRLAANGRLYIEDAVRERLDPDELYAEVKATAARDGTGVHVSAPRDPGQASEGQKLAIVRMLNGYSVHVSPETGDKEFRALPFSAQVNAGNVVVVRGPWTDAYVAEMTRFPRGYKDQVDATTRAHARLLQLSGMLEGEERFVAPRVVMRDEVNS